MVFTTATGVMIPFMYFCSRGFSANSTTSFLSWMIFPLRYVLVLGIIPILAVILMTKVSSPSRPPRLGSADYLPIREGEMRGGFRFSESLIMWLVISFVVSFQTQGKCYYFRATVIQNSYLCPSSPASATWNHNLVLHWTLIYIYKVEQKQRWLSKMYILR